MRLFLCLMLVPYTATGFLVNKDEYIYGYGGLFVYLSAYEASRGLHRTP